MLNSRSNFRIWVKLKSSVDGGGGGFAKSCDSKSDPGASSDEITCEYIRNAKSQAPSQTYRIRSCILTRFPGG